tara:strand:+ start:274 stop:507 length:234 start_codon:yes stop_codon:yes gene_type:complete
LNKNTMELFEHDWGIGKSEIEDVDITTTILYFSKEELKIFKTLCKKGIKKMYGEAHQQRGNLPDYLLTLIKQHNENN